LRSDPSQWSVTHVRHWLQWAVDNFNLEGIDAAQFQSVGLDLLRQGRDRFLLRAPPYVGDILWEHLDILQKGRKPPSVRLIRCNNSIGILGDAWAMASAEGGVGGEWDGVWEGVSPPQSTRGSGGAS